MEKQVWERVRLAGEAVTAIGKYAVAGSLAPPELQRQLADNMSAVDAAHADLLPIIQNHAAEPEASTVLYEALLSIGQEDDEESICLRAIARLSRQPRHEPAPKPEIDTPKIRPKKEYTPDDPALFARVRSEDPDERCAAQTELISRYGNFVRMVAGKQFRKLPKTPGFDYDDFEQEGMIAMLHAAEIFEPHFNAKFLSYADKHIVQHMMRHYRNMRSAVRVPIHIHEKISKVGALNDWRWHRRLSMLKLREIAEQAEVSPYLEVNRGAGSLTVGNLLEADILSSYMGSLDTGFSPHDMGPDNDYVLDESQGLENLTDRNPPQDIAELAARSSLEPDIKHALGFLPEREREILRLRFGLDDGKVRTLEEVGQHFGVTRERIRNIEARALAALRNPTSRLANNLRGYLSDDQ